MSLRNNQNVGGLKNIFQVWEKETWDGPGKA
jgi:hypothetical protein